MLDYNDDKTRASLAQTLAVRCDDARSCPAFTLVANHFKSKGSSCDDIDDPDANDGQVGVSPTGSVVSPTSTSKAEDGARQEGVRGHSRG